MWGEKVYGLAHTAHAFHKSQSRAEQDSITAAGSPFPAGSFPLVLHCNAFTIPSRHRGAQKAVPKKPTPETERPASRAVPAPGLIEAPSLSIARCEISRCSSAPLRLRSDTLRLCDCPWGRHGFRFYFDLQQGGGDSSPDLPRSPRVLWMVSDWASRPCVRREAPERSFQFCPPILIREGRRHCGAKFACQRCRKAVGTPTAGLSRHAFQGRLFLCVNVHPYDPERRQDTVYSIGRRPAG